MTHLLTHWLDHSPVSPVVEMALLRIALGVFGNMDWGELRLKQAFAAEVRRAEKESFNESVQEVVSELLNEFGEIRELWQSIRLLSSGTEANVPLPSNCICLWVPWCLGAIVVVVVVAVSCLLFVVGCACSFSPRKFLTSPPVWPMFPKRYFGAVPWQFHHPHLTSQVLGNFLLRLRHQTRVWGKEIWSQV